MKRTKNPTPFGPFLHNVLGMYNRKTISTTGAVHYCSRCGIVTKDNRELKLRVFDAWDYFVGQRVVFGAAGQQYSNIVVAVDYEENLVTFGGAKALVPWKEKIAKAFRAIKDVTKFAGTILLVVVLVAFAVAVAGFALLLRYWIG